MVQASFTQQGRPSRRGRADRLTVDLPSGTLTALKVHAAQHEMTIREVVTTLVQKAIKQGKHA